MDNLTHSLVGAVIGQTGLKKKTGLGMPALIIGANLPDVDAACLFWLEGTEHLGFRRGITHGPIALLLLPLIMAGILWGFDRWQAKRGKRPEGRLPINFKWLYLLGLIGCISHPLLDWMNVYGIRFWEPFAPTWAYGDTLFIIDIWLWALLIVTTWWSMRAERRGANWKRPAWIGIIVGLAYIAANFAITKTHEIRDGDVYFPGRVVIASPMPVFSWQREMIIGGNGRYNIVDPAIEDQDSDSSDHAHAMQYVQTVGDCEIAPIVDATVGNSQAEAFFFWSRAPLAIRQEDGSVVLYDARFFDPRARDRFSVELTDVQCTPLPEYSSEAP